MQSVKRVGTAIQKAYGGDGLTIACQVKILFSFLIQTFCKHLFFVLRVVSLQYLGWESSGSVSSSRPLPHHTSEVRKRPVRK